MSKKLQFLIIAVALLLFGSNAHAVPVSTCVYDAANFVQTCNLYESDASGNPSELSSARTASPYGADWAPRWVVVYKSDGSTVSSVVQVVKSVPPVLNGLFAEEAFLYSDGYANFATILDIALLQSPCTGAVTETSPCLLTIVENAEGIATFDQPFVNSASNPNTTLECPASLPCDTIIVHRLLPTTITTTYRASVDFSSLQGFRNWYYLDGSGTEMSYLNNRWRGNETYLYLAAWGGHPGNSSDAVRRWKAPQAGSVTITGNAVDFDTSCGSGAMVYIKKNSTILSQQVLANGNTTGVTFNLTTQVAAGDNIDFGMNRGTDNVNWCDLTGFDPTIVFTTP